ncbi:MAG: CRISPR-associated helicase Cas3' [Bacillota bacterium]
MPFYAHRDERRFYPLSAHLAGVAAGAAARLARLPAGEELLPAALLAGLAHDFGKYTGYFQEYLRTGRGGPEKQHAFISGLWAAHLAGRLRLPPVQQLALFLAVARHHQELTDPAEYLLPSRDLANDWELLEPTLRERLQVVAAQVADLRRRAGAVAASLRSTARCTARFLAGSGLAVPEWLRRDWGEILSSFLDNWVTSFGGLYPVFRRLKRQAGTDLTAYVGLLALFSGLIDADKVHAARVAEAERVTFPIDMVDRYRAAHFGPPRTAMERLRENLYRNAVTRAEQASSDQRLFTLTAPTGSGKTLAGLAAAFRLRERFAKMPAAAPRIIYALPFTSIVDQTFAVAEAVLRNTLPEREALLPSAWLLKHHHLAEPVYRRDTGGEELSLDEALLLTESWQSEVVITTFVQFFHTLVGYQNRMLKKFHRLAGAVVILDEVQNIPVEYWPLVEETLRQACTHLGMRVILMTATRPEWFTPGEALELAGGPETVRRQFAAVNRVTVTAEIAPRTVEQAVVAFLGEYRRERSYLVILNTIKSSIAFYRMLREAWGEQRPPLYYLSTNIVPAERERRLREIRELLARGEKLVLVSTQVVEAGVDLDFDAVWRDLGPVDAVVQAAGRCNRHFRHERGHVHLFHLVDEDAGRSLASFVYGEIHALAARRLFTEHPVLTEPDFFDAVADYFRAVREAKSAAESEAVLRAMAVLRFKRKTTEEEPRAVSDFALIRDLPHYVDVFVCADAVAEETWERYQATVARERDLHRRRAAYLALRRDFRRYLVSVPDKLLVGRLTLDSHPPVIPSYLLAELYDPETGFKRVDDERAVIF